MFSTVDFPKRFPEKNMFLPLDEIIFKEAILSMNPSVPGSLFMGVLRGNMLTNKLERLIREFRTAVTARQTEIKDVVIYY